MKITVNHAFLQVFVVVKMDGQALIVAQVGAYSNKIITVSSLLSINTRY